MKIKLKDSYGNEFLTTQKGFSIHKNEIKEADFEDAEVRSYLQQSILVPFIEPEQAHTKIIKDGIPKNTVKEIVTDKNNPQEALKSSDNTMEPVAVGPKEDIPKALQVPESDEIPEGQRKQEELNKHPGGGLNSTTNVNL